MSPRLRSLQRTHWLFPVVVAEPETVVGVLGSCGVEASRATSSIAVVEAPAGYVAPVVACEMMSGMVFVPVYPELPEEVRDRIVGVVNASVDGASERLARV